MKILIASKTKNWQTESLRKSAKKKGFDLSVVAISEKTARRLSSTDVDIVIWRSGNISLPEKQRLMLSIKPDKLINLAYQTQTNVPQKSYQYNIVSEKTTIKTIPTFYFANKKEFIQAIRQKKAKLPLIAKPNLGSKGFGVRLIKTQKDAETLSTDDYPKYVFQTYIENDGDYRVFTVGGIPVSYMKRVSFGNDFLNNISQGGLAEEVKSISLKKELGDMASSLACLFDLNICGVDFIIDKKSGETYFMEVNTAPQWEGIQSITPHSISDNIVDYCKLLASRKKIGVFNVVKRSYDNNLVFLNDKKFHYLSRMWLWTKEKKYFTALQVLKKDYIGLNQGEIETKIKKILTSKNDTQIADKQKKEREIYYKKYPDLKKYNSLLFKWLFTKNIYCMDIKPIISKYVKEEELIRLKETLLKDERAVLILSTHAINFFYNLREYLGKEKDTKFLNVDSLNDLAHAGYQRQGNTLLELYFYTHCIIGESRFYSRRVRADVSTYKKMLTRCEQIIAQEFFNVSLDNKVEFLVACRLVGYVTYLEGQIFSEAQNSLSSIGNFLVDSNNIFSAKGRRNGFMKSEHRNVLYLMSRLPFSGNDSN